MRVVRPGKENIAPLSGRESVHQVPSPCYTCDRLYNDRRDLSRILSDAPDHVIRRIVSQDGGLQHCLFEHPSRERIILSYLFGGTRHVHADVVVPAVIAALELDYPLLLGDGPR